MFLFITHNFYFYLFKGTVSHCQVRGTEPNKLDTLTSYNSHFDLKNVFFRAFIYFISEGDQDHCPLLSFIV